MDCLFLGHFLGETLLKHVCAHLAGHKSQTKHARLGSNRVYFTPCEGIERIQTYHIEGQKNNLDSIRKCEGCRDTGWNYAKEPSQVIAK